MEVNETKEVLTALFHLKLAYQEAMEDGSFDWTDATKFFPVIKPIITAVKNIDLVPQELNELNETEIDDLAHSIGVMFECDKLDIEKIKEALNVLNVLKDFIVNKL